MIGMRIGKMGEGQEGMIRLISEVENVDCSLMKKGKAHMQKEMLLLICVCGIALLAV